MGISLSDQTLACIRRKQIQSQSVLNMLSGGLARGKSTNFVNYSGNTASKLCVSGRVQSALGLNMYNARGQYSYASSFAGTFHYDVYMYRVDGRRYIGGPEYTGGMAFQEFQLDYFYTNMGNPWKMVDDFNFANGIKTFCYAGDNKSGGSLTFRYGGSSQVIPASALPRLDANNYPALKAQNNVLMLQSSSYYSFGAGSEKIVWAVTKNGFMGEIDTNFWLYGDDDKQNELSNNAQTLLNKLKSGNLYGISEYGKYGGISYDEVKKVFAAVGIKEGKFSIGVDGEVKDYYFCASGRVIDASSLEKKSEWDNSCDYFVKGYKEGDMVKVTDSLELPVDKNGHIHTSAMELSRYM